MYILGISCYYHDAAACLIKDGKLVAAAEEERFTRKKHDPNFPINSINFCLEKANISSKDLIYIGFYEKPLVKFERMLSQHLEMFPYSFWSFYNSIPSWLIEKLRVPKTLKRKIKYKGNVLFVDHHLAHASSSFLVSPFKEAAILTIDGVGEWTTTAVSYGKENNIRLLKEIKFPHSIGLLYSTVTAHLGFSVNNSEYKIMSLASYGKPIYYEKFMKIIDLKDDGSYRFDMSYFAYHYRLSMPSKKFIKEFGPIRKPSEELTQHHKDIAASLQKVNEAILFKILNYLYKKTKCNNLCMSGGVALNSVANGKIKKNTPFKNVFIQPASSDAGTSLGAAFYIYNSILNNKRNYVMDSAYLGPEFSYDKIKNFLDSNKINYKEFKDEKELINKTAKLIFKDNIVGWFQGRMEFGPRALGNRSILANPCNPQMKQILNEKVKHREEFRPFAPVIIKEKVKEYFDIDKEDEKFMLFVYPVRESKRKIIPAVTHIDGTARLQTVNKNQNPRYYNLINEFEKLSKVPVLINTSFNIRGEPIVCTPEEAYRCMMGTEIDYLIMDNFLIRRNDNLKDKWSSEKYED